MTDANVPADASSDAAEAAEQPFDGEVATNRALEQGLGVGARELAAIHESGAEGTLERPAEPGQEPEAEDVEVGGAGRSANVLDRED